MPFSEGSLVISCHPCLICSIFITSQPSDRRHRNEASSFRRQLQSAALNLLLCAWLGKSNCMNPFFFSALPFRVACAFCESVPAAYPRRKRHLYTFVCICVSPLWSAQGSIMSNSYVPLPPKNSLCARRKQTEPRGWHEMTSQIVHSSTSTTSTYPFRILVRVPTACICLWLSACVSSVSSPSSSSSDSGKSRMATKPVPVTDAKSQLLLAQNSENTRFE